MGKRFVYVMPDDWVQEGGTDGLTLVEVFRVVWRGKWLIAFVSFLFASASIAYALSASEWYVASVLLAPAKERSTPTLGGALGGLANLAGVSVGGGGSAEPIAVLQSREFTEEFVRDHQLLPVLFAERWDSESQSWKVGSTEVPDLRDAEKYFRESVRGVAENDETGLITLSIEWTDPSMAAAWANSLVERLNDRMRSEALVEAETNVRFLREELATTNLVTLQQSISRLLESEIQKLMLARGNEEFAFRVIDPAQVPKERSKPARTLIVVASTFVGAVLALVALFVRRAIQVALATS